MKKEKLIGIIITLVGIFMIYWTQSHSPNAKLGKIIGNQLSGSYTMSEPGYYVSLLLSVGVVAFGLYKFIKGK